MKLNFDAIPNSLENLSLPISPYIFGKKKIDLEFWYIYDKIKAQKGDLRKKKIVINFKIGGKDGRKRISE